MEPQTPNRKYYNETESQELKNELMSRWTRLESTPGVFRYKLNVQKQKVLPGDYKFVVQVIKRLNNQHIYFCVKINLKIILF